MLRSLQVVAGISKLDGGPAYSVPRLAENLNKHLNSRLASIGTPEMRIEEIDQFDCLFFEASRLPILSNFGWSETFNRMIDSYAAQNGIIHTHGLWLMPNIYPSWAIRRNSGSTSRLVHSPRGMLGKEARRISAWKKEPIWWLWQKDALRTAHCLHATAESEYEEIRQAGLKNPVAVIQNGIDIPQLPPAQREAREQKTILSLGRIHPKKGLDRLVRAWATLEDRFPNWSLRLVGSPEVGHDLDLIALGKQLNLKRFEIQAAVYGEAKWQVYQESDLFVLPTLNENFGITVAEALACELPVISTKGAPWRGVEQEGCGWWIDHGVEPLAAALVRAMALDEATRANMGKLGKAWMARDFGWPAIGAEMANVYRWLQQGGPIPTSVRLT